MPETQEQIIKLEPKEEQQISSFVIQQHLIVNNDLLKKEVHYDSNITTCNQLDHVANIKTEEDYNSVNQTDSVQITDNFDTNSAKNNVNPVYKCEECNFTAPRRYKVNQHRAKHSKVLHNCNQCDYTTKWKYHLKKHILIHSIILLNCDKCDYTTTSVQYLKQHSTKHSNAFYDCDQCDYKTKWKQQLRRHRLVHSKIQNKCDQCGYTTKSKASLQHHILRHSKLQCDDATKSEQCLQQHTDSGI